MTETKKKTPEEKEAIKQAAIARKEAMSDITDNQDRIIETFRQCRVPVNRTSLTHTLVRHMFDTYSDHEIAKLYMESREEGNVLGNFDKGDEEEEEK